MVQVSWMNSGAITEMGNALGLVRMVWMGGLHHTSAGFGLVQGSKTPGTYEKVTKLLNMSTNTVGAGVILHRTLKHQEMPIERTNFFRILTRVFVEEIQNAENKHLNKFYVVVPAIIMNAVEMILQVKEK